MIWLKRAAGVLVLLVVFAIWASMRLSAPIAPSMGEPKSIYLEKGASSGSAYEQLAQLSQKNGGNFSNFQIKFLAWVSLRASNYKVGEYEFDAKASLGELLTRLSTGKVTQRKLRIAEGVTWREIKKELAKADLNHDAQELSMADLVKAVGITEPNNPSSIEGLVFPDTYMYRKGEKETDILKRAHELLNKKIAPLWEKRAGDLPYANEYKALTMASIVEKETGLDKDRPMIAAVFVNRLKQGMMLQTDPTVIYGVGDAFKGDLTTSMMHTDTPYNTYTRSGLPPTPIATASLASISAAFNPANSDVIFFVGRGDGSSEFTNNLSAHNAAVNKYILKK